MALLVKEHLNILTTFRISLIMHTRSNPFGKLIFRPTDYVYTILQYNIG